MSNVEGKKNIINTIKAKSFLTSQWPFGQAEGPSLPMGESSSQGGHGLPRAPPAPSQPAAQPPQHCALRTRHGQKSVCYGPPKEMSSLHSSSCCTKTLDCFKKTGGRAFAFYELSTEAVQAQPGAQNAAFSGLNNIVIFYCCQ